MRKNNVWIDGIMGVVVGDALGCPVEFEDRSELDAVPVTTMEEYGTFDLPKGSWTDDTSLTLALLDSIRQVKGIDLEDIMNKFSDWFFKGEYTPFGLPFDVGKGTEMAMWNFRHNKDIFNCGGKTVRDNGNGSLMRILPACIFCHENKMEDEEAINTIHLVSGLTHNHLRAKMACGLYYFMACSIMDGTGNLLSRLVEGLNKGFSFYSDNIANLTELAYYGRLRDLEKFTSVSRKEIKSTGYVVDTLEAAVWSLVTTDNFRDCELKAVNLGDDTDTVGAIAGGLAGLYYGYEGIPEDWVEVIQRKEWIFKLLEEME